MADLILKLNVREFRCDHSKVISPDVYVALFTKLFRTIFLVL
jgi:hypothetical protein